MRTYPVVATLLFSTLALAACTGILGDFAIAPGDGGASDASHPDATTDEAGGHRGKEGGAGSHDGSHAKDARGDSSPDAALDGKSTSDAAVDAGPLFTCREGNTGANPYRVDLTAAAGDNDAAIFQYDQIAVAPLSGSNGDRARAVVAVANDGGFIAEAITYNTGSIAPQTNIVSFYVPGGHQGYVVDIQRYATGFAVLYVDQGMASNQFGAGLAVVKIDDSSSVWGTASAVSAAQFDHTHPLTARLAIVDATADAYFVAVMDNENAGATDVVRGQFVYANSADAFRPLSVLTTAPTGTLVLAAPAIAFDSETVYVLLGPGPSTTGLGSELVGQDIIPDAGITYSDAGVPATMVAVPFQDAGGALSSLGMASSRAVPGSVDLTLFTVVTPNLATKPANSDFVTGQTTVTGLSNLDWSNLHASLGAAGGATPTYGSFLVNEPQFHWETVDATDYLLGTAIYTPVISNGTGLNFAWRNAKTGALLGEMTGDGRLLADALATDEAGSGGAFFKSNVAFAAPPTNGIYQFLVVYEIEVPSVGSGGATRVGNVWATSVNCAAAQ
jgi:hypothetical protein